MSTAATAGLGNRIANLSAKVSSVPAGVFESAGDAAGYSLTQRGVLDSLVVAFQNSDLAAYDYWSNVCNNVYVNLDANRQAAWNETNFVQSMNDTTKNYTYGEAWNDQGGLLGGIGSELSWLGGAARTVVTGGPARKPVKEPAGTDWTSILIALAVAVAIWYLLLR